MPYVLRTGGGTYWKRGDDTYRQFRAKFGEATRFVKSESAEARANELRKAETKRMRKSRSGTPHQERTIIVESVLF